MQFHYMAQLEWDTRIHLKWCFFQDEIGTSNFRFTNVEQANAQVLRQWMENFFNRLYQILKGDIIIKPQYKSQY